MMKTFLKQRFSNYFLEYPLCSLLLIWTLAAHGQSTVTYTVDEDFSTAQTLRSQTSVFDIYPMVDGGFFLGGGFNMMFTNPDSPFIQGLAMVTESGSVHPDWGGDNQSFVVNCMFMTGASSL
jgi:hypothetical protein